MNAASRRTIVASAVVIAIFAIAVWVRVPALTDRPMHPDEAVQAMRTLLLLETGRFVYDPTDLHGPAFYYAAAVICLITGRTAPAEVDESLMRALPLAAGLGVVLVPLLFHGLGVVGRIAASALLATCSAMAFYSTMFFHEMLHVLFCGAFLVFALRWLAEKEKPLPLVALLAGMMLGLAIATKESWLLFVLAATVAVGVSFSPNPNALAEWRRRLSPRLLLLFGIALTVPPLLLFTNFLQTPEEIWKPFAAPFHYLGRIDGSGTAGDHAHPVGFFLARITVYHSVPGPWWFLATPLLLGIVGFALSLRSTLAGCREAMQVLAVGGTSFLLLIVHLVIPYKTPWLLLLSLFGLCLVSGHAIEVAWRSKIAIRVLVVILFGGVIAFLAWQAHETTGRFASDPRNPWVYSAASPDVKNLASRIHEAAACSETPLRVDVWAVDYWPLPWYLRDMPGVGYWTTIPDGEPAPVVIMNVEQEPGMAGILLELGYERQYFGLRHEVPVALYLHPMLLSRLRQLWAERTPAR